MISFCIVYDSIKYPFEKKSCSTLNEISQSELAVPVKCQHVKRGQISVNILYDTAYMRMRLITPFLCVSACMRIR